MAAVTTTTKPTSSVQGTEFSSCIELLNGNMQVQWDAHVNGVIIRLSARMADNEYMAFGISGADGRTQMIGADVTVAYHEANTDKFHAVDYYISSKSQVYHVFGILCACTIEQNLACKLRI